MVRIVTTDIPHSCLDTVPAQSGVSYITNTADDTVKATLLFPVVKDSIYELSYYAAVETAGGIGGGGFPPGKPYRFYVILNGDSFPSPIFNKRAWQYVDTIFKASVNSTVIKIAGDKYYVFSDLSDARIDNISLKKITSTSINNASLDSRILIYPNPTKDRIFFNHLPENIEFIEVYDRAGIIVRRYEKSRIVNSLDLSLLSPGIYFVRIVTPRNSLIKKISLLNNY